MRFEGILKTWDDDRGFGFLESTQGGQEIFVHVKAFKTRGGRPQINQVFTFEIELGPQGKRAKNVEPMRTVRTRLNPRHEPPAQWGTTTLFVIPVFMVIFVVVSCSGGHPSGLPPCTLVSAWLRSWHTRSTSRLLGAKLGAFPRALFTL